MKKITLLLTSIFFLTTNLQAQYHIWEDHHVLSQNRLPARADFMPFKLKKGDRQISLDGQWRFNWTKTPDEQPADFFKTDFDDSAWDLFPVPGDWEVNHLLLEKGHAYGTPIYSSSGYTFKIQPPYVMKTPKEKYTSYTERNPTGCYRRPFTLPQEWKSKEVYIRLGSVASAFELYVNGKYVGYSQGSMEPAEFRLTDYLFDEGNNPTPSPRGEGWGGVLALKVYKYCDGSYLEDQDQWRLGGIHRSITLFATEKIRIADLGVRTELSDNYTKAKVIVHPSLSVIEGQTGDGFHLEAELFDAQGNKINRRPMTAPADTMLNLSAKGAILNARTPQRGYAKWGWMECDVENPQLWSAETPFLYTLKVMLKDSNGSIVEQTEQKIGLRELKIQDGQFLVNGVPTRFRGVNRHEFSSTLGKVMTEEAMLRDILLMKRGNVNAVRTSHYPNTERWYELCDSLGLYVMDEMDIEEHGLRGQLASDPEWTAAFMDRTQRCVIRDRNHACVVFWSLGNESGYGPNFAATSQWIREYDPTRPIHYEGAQQPLHSAGGQLLSDQDPPTVDVISRFYPRTQDDYLNPGVKDNNMERPENARWERLLSIAQKEDQRTVGAGLVSARKSPESGGHEARPYGGRPVLTSEYAHAMGNALGNFQEYWDEIYSNPRMLGGFIWEWADAEIYVRRPDGKIQGNYGGDFGDQPNLKAFCVKGIVTSDRQETTKYQEMKKVYSPVKVELTDGQPRLIARDPSIRLSDYTIETKTEHGFTNVEVRLAVDKPWAKKGHLVTWEQFPTVGAGLVSARIDARADTRPAPTKAFKKTSQKAITPENIIDIIKPHLFRAPTDNDKGFGNWIAKDWTNNGLDTAQAVVSNVERRTLDHGAQQVSWTTTTTLKEGKIQIDYTATFNKKGNKKAKGGGFDEGLTLEAVFTPSGTLPPLPCLGITIQAPQYSRVKWFGLGPMDTYPDRTAATMMGLYDQPISEQYTHYVRPQDSGNHGETTIVQLYGEKSKVRTIENSNNRQIDKSTNRNLGSPITISSETPFSFSALPYSIKQIYSTAHDCDLSPEPYTFINIDCAVLGIGNSSCGPGVLTKYSIPQKKHTLRINIK